MNQYSQTGQIQQYSNIQPVWKFIFLYIITFGIYQIPWGHKHWKFVKEREGLKINAWLRSWFLPFTLFWLAKRIFALAEDKGYREKPSPAAITSLFWFFVVLKQLPNILGLLALLSFFPLLTVLKAVNFYWEKEQPNLQLRKSWTGGEIAWTVFGGILWVFILVGLFASTEG
ncbi:MAG: hypothetical protein V7K32_28140 [Nostoc sp.]|uniref:hypothetical protein n=1 Tax=Nostoc sp. TaxID=1180 RepID=UPI002FFD0A3D